MKDIKEIAMDKEFERLGIRIWIYHFREAAPFNGVSIATTERQSRSQLRFDVVQACMQSFAMVEKATLFLKAMKRLGIYGVGICDHRDVFLKRVGRIEAKRRLLRQLKGRTFNEKEL